MAIQLRPGVILQKASALTESKEGELPKWIKRAANACGLAGAAGLVATYVLGLWVSPPDEHLGQSVRLLYAHAPTAWLAMLCFGGATVASALYLFPRTRSFKWDALALTCAETGVAFLLLTVVLGAIWGHITWGVWWTWDARLTSTAILAVLYLGYLAVRKLEGSPEARAKRAAVVALFSALDLPIVHFSVNWWNTLHQGATVLRPNLNPTIHGLMLLTLGIAFISLTLILVWMITIRYEAALLEREVEDLSIRAVISEVTTAQVPE